jgi:hypothetical protein
MGDFETLAVRDTWYWENGLDPPLRRSEPFRPRGAKDNERQLLGIPMEVPASCAPRWSSGRIARSLRIGTLTRVSAGQNLPPKGQFNRCRTFARVLTHEK